MMFDVERNISGLVIFSPPPQPQMLPGYGKASKEASIFSLDSLFWPVLHQLSLSFHIGK